jgi:hypothetical protein
MIGRMWLRQERACGWFCFFWIIIGGGHYQHHPLRSYVDAAACWCPTNNVLSPWSLSSVQQRRAAAAAAIVVGQPPAPPPAIRSSFVFSCTARRRRRLFGAKATDRDIDDSNNNNGTKFTGRRRLFDDDDEAAAAADTMEESYEEREMKLASLFQQTLPFQALLVAMAIAFAVYIGISGGITDGSERFFDDDVNNDVMMWNVPNYYDADDSTAAAAENGPIRSNSVHI